MNLHRALFLATAFAVAPAFIASASAATVDTTPPRLKRADSFLGIHFDFHAGPDCKEVGQNTTPAMIENIINLVHPDYLQIDCKGHPGYSSYPTKVGQPVPGFVGDPLRIWRDVTARRGVGLYMHYSGVWDGMAVLKPGWAAIMADGTPSTKATSFWGPYAKELLIPQLRELAGDYGIDGAWVDGECWASVVDYSPAALAAFTKATGITAIPRKAGEPLWFEFLEFNREAFRRYLRDYLAAVNQTHPRFQLCSNWAFTDHMPEPVTAPVAFLSGDYSPQDSVNSARLSARFLAHQGKPWDLMAWSFTTKPTRLQKPAGQLQREAAVVLAQGGGFQAYFSQKRDGSIHEEQMPVMAEVAKFCRARQELSHHGTSVPQVAVLFSLDDAYRRVNSLFGRNLARINGVLQALLESQHSVDVVGEHHLAGRFAQYPLIVVPECDYLAPEFCRQLTEYVQNGGSLLLVGPGAAKLFERELGVTVTAEPKNNTALRLTHAGADSDLTARASAVTLGQGAREFGRLRNSKAPDAPAQPAASISSFGRGKIAAAYFTAGQVYAKDRPAALRTFVDALARELFPRPLVEVKGKGVDVTVTRNHGKLLVHLVNTSGPHATESILEQIAPVGPLTVSIRQPRQPARVTLEPSGQPLRPIYRDGKIELTVPSVAIHEIVVVTP
jgi:hypothetical protein